MPLLVEGDPVARAWALACLQELCGPESVAWAETWEDALSAMRDPESGIGVALVGLDRGSALPGEGLQALLREFPGLPWLALMDDGDREAESVAITAGAAGWLPRSGLTSSRVARAIRFALEHVRREARGREERERFQTLIESISETVIITGADGSVRYVSPQIEELFGGPRGTFPGRNAFDFIHPEDRPHARRDFQAVARGEDLPGATEFRVLRSDGTTRRVAASGRRLLGRPGVAGVVITLRDVTARVELEERLRQALKMEAVGRLAGGVAHDFNNILTVLLGHADFLLADLEEGSPLRPELEEIRRAAGRAAVLTRRLLAFSRRQILLPRVVDPAEVVRGMEEMLRRLLGGHVGLEVRAPFAGHVRADPAQLEEVLLNLAANARDAMPNGGTLTLTVEPVPITREEAAARPYTVHPGRYVRLSVSDTGHGMDPATQERVFEPFFTTKEAGAGTGLGLPMVYGVVKQSRGYIWVESALGEGTTFRIYLPRISTGRELEDADSGGFGGSGVGSPREVREY